MTIKSEAVEDHWEPLRALLNTHTIHVSFGWLETIIKDESVRAERAYRSKGPGSPKDGTQRTATSDPITWEQVAELLFLSKSRVEDVVGEQRKKGNPPPEPAIPHTGRSPHYFRYSELLPWLRKVWPRQAEGLPEDYAEALKLLSQRRKCPDR